MWLPVARGGDGEGLLANGCGAFWGVMRKLWNQMVVMSAQHCEYIKNH